MENHVARLSFPINLNNREEVLWYTFPSKFKKYLITENLDAAVVGLLFYALEAGSDLELQGPVSARLFYTLNHYLIPALCLREPGYTPIKIKTTKLNEVNLNEAMAAGTGMSCGVDSFATYFDHEQDKKSFEIKFLTFLNAGSHGDHGGPKARETFYDRLKAVRELGAKLDKEVIEIDSNLSELLQMNFQKTHTLRNLSCIMNLQKLFKNYYYSSPHRFDHYDLLSNDTGDFDILTMQMLSTESTDFFSSGARWNRIERTNLISNFPLTHEHLDVCTAPQFKEAYLNCSVCDKCMRTMLTLDLLSKLHLYKQVFNIEKYKQKKSLYIGKIIARKNKEAFSRDVYKLLKKETGINFIHYFYFGKYKFRELRKKSRNLIKKIP
ncbi:MAG: hypothetical protein ACQEWD_04315 [Bacteroidota bacterium]